MAWCGFAPFATFAPEDSMRIQFLASAVAFLALYSSPALGQLAQGELRGTVVSTTADGLRLKVGQEQIGIHPAPPSRNQPRSTPMAA